jgi:rhamnulokinase
VQAQPFNTIYQLAASRESPQLAAADGLLLIPDLMGYWLTGGRVAELTNASTTGLLDIRTQCWAEDLIRTAGASASLLPELVRPGHVVGDLRSDVREAAGQPGGTELISVGSHDTASAVAAIPAKDRRFAYVATGTWSLVGVEIDQPVLTEESRLAGYTNELGLDGRVRYLRNVMGLWLLQECLRDWGDPPLGALLSAASEQPPLRSVVDAAAAEFLPPGDMPRRLQAACRRSHQFEPQTVPEIVRCVLDSLALGHARAVLQAVSLAEYPADVVHLVGGGVNNSLLCQLTADAVGLPVIAGPAEAAALGNALVQRRTLRGRKEDLESLRLRVADRVDVTRYEPRTPSCGWEQAEARIFQSDDLWIGRH